MATEKQTFLLGFGNRGFFPPKYMTEARFQVPAALKELGYDSIMKDVDGEDLGAVEAQDQGRSWAKWARSLDPESYDGIIWEHPQFGNETGLVPAVEHLVKEKGVPLLLTGYPDRADALDWDSRRDTACGLMSSMDVLGQARIPFVKLKPHVVHPESPEYASNIDLFGKICAGEATDPYLPVRFEDCTYGVNPLDGLVMLAVGARTSPFLTCRYDEVAARDHGISIETEDMLQIHHQMSQIEGDDPRLLAKIGELGAYTNWEKALKEAPEALVTQAKFAVIMDEYVDGPLQPNAVGVRCWTEPQEVWNISVCATLSHLNHGRSDGIKIPTACEVDMGNALMMHTMLQYGGTRVACQDWNNNHSYEENMIEAMHCGPHDIDWLDLDAKLRDDHTGHYVETQAILDKVYEGPSFGCIQGRFKPGPVTIGSATIGPGDIFFYVLEGEVTEDMLPPEYFGSAAVIQIPEMQEALLQIGQGGYKHHFSMCDGHIAQPMIDSLKQYDGFRVMDLRADNLAR